MKPIMTTLLVFAAAVAHGESHEALVERAFDSIETEIRDRWAFTRTETSAKGIYVATHDPRRDPAWDLLTVDGREPTSDETEEFLSERTRERGDDEEDDDDTRSMVSPGSVELVDETDERWLFNFSPLADSEDERKFMEAVQGRLEVAKDGHYVRKLHLRNLETIKPGKGVKVKVFDTSFEFAPAPDGSAVLPARVRAKIQGRAMLVVGIDEEQTVEFSDYQRVIE